MFFLFKHPLLSTAGALVAAQFSPFYPSTWRRPLALLEGVIPSGLLPSSSMTPLQTAAYSMVVDLESNGYKLSSQNIYEAFQTAAGLTADGMPGSNTMAALQSAVTSLPSPENSWPPIDGYTAVSIEIYPWTKASYDGVDSPPSNEWNR